jgi:hypothetical protein
VTGQVSDLHPSATGKNMSGGEFIEESWGSPRRSLPGPPQFGGAGRGDAGWAWAAAVGRGLR